MVLWHHPSGIGNSCAMKEPTHPSSNLLAHSSPRDTAIHSVIKAIGVHKTPLGSSVLMNGNDLHNPQTWEYEALVPIDTTRFVNLTGCAPCSIEVTSGDINLAVNILRSSSMF